MITVRLIENTDTVAVVCNGCCVLHAVCTGSIERDRTIERKALAVEAAFDRGWRKHEGPRGTTSILCPDCEGSAEIVRIADRGLLPDPKEYATWSPDHTILGKEQAPEQSIEVALLDRLDRLLGLLERAVAVWERPREPIFRRVVYSPPQTTVYPPPTDRIELYGQPWVGEQGTKENPVTIYYACQEIPIVNVDPATPKASWYGYVTVTSGGVTDDKVETAIMTPEKKDEK